MTAVEVKVFQRRQKFAEVAEIAKIHALSQIKPPQTGQSRQRAHVPQTCGMEIEGLEGGQSRQRAHVRQRLAPPEIEELETGQPRQRVHVRQRLAPPEIEML